MNKLLLITLFIAGVFMSINATAQKKQLTTTTATKKMGYIVINSGEDIKIYKYVHASHSPKDALNYTPKYYFRYGPNTILQQLTLTNLKNISPDNHPFHDALDANFKEDKELYTYDNFHKMYKINWLFKENNK